MITVITGKNAYAARQELQRLTDEFTAGQGGSIERFDGTVITSADGVLDAVRSISFLDPSKLVIVRDFGQSKDLLERIEDVVSQTADSTQLVLIDQALDKRSVAYKYLKKSDAVEVKEYAEQAPYEIEKWLSGEATGMGVKLGPSEARLLVEYVCPNQQMLHSELKKLALAESVITKEHIMQLVEKSPRGKVFDLMDELFKGDAKKSWNLYSDQRALGEEPQKILAMITWQLQQLTLAVFAPTSSKDELVRAGMSPYTAQKSLALARTITRDNLVYYVQQLAAIDAQSKTSADVESALEVYFTDVAVRQTTS